MDLRPITKAQKAQYNRAVDHVIQSWEWGEFRQSLGLRLLRYGLYENGKLTRAFELTLHKIPFTSSFVGYLPKGPFPDAELAESLAQVGKTHKCAFIKIEPNIAEGKSEAILDSRFLPSPKPLFTQYNYLLDLDQSEEALLKKMHQKTRYNIKVAQKHGVTVEERTDDEALEIHLQLYFETTIRQGYHGHDKNYHRKVWQTLTKANMARVLIAFYTPPGENKPIPLCSWMLFNFKNILYYPYGGSSESYKNVMAPTLLAWEAIKIGRRLGCKSFDLWGAASPDAKSDDPFLGFTRFKAHLGGELVKYIGTFDLVFNPLLYKVFTAIDRTTSLKILLLKLLGKA